VKVLEGTEPAREEIRARDAGVDLPDALARLSPFRHATEPTPVASELRSAQA
jgi:hypothetical protein